MFENRQISHLHSNPIWQPSNQMSRHDDVFSAEEPEVKSARTSEVSDRERREEVVADDELSETEISPAAGVVDVVKDASGEDFPDLSHHSDWASNVKKWKQWGLILLDCEAKVMSQCQNGNGNRRHFCDFQNMMTMFSQLRILAGKKCGKFKMTPDSRLHVSDLSLQWSKFVRILKGEFSCDDERYLSSMELFLSSVESLKNFLDESPTQSRPHSAPGDSRGNREDRSKAWNDFLQTLNGNKKRDSTPFSAVKELPEYIRDLVRDGEQIPQRDIGDLRMNFLTNYLGFVRKVMKDLGNEACRLHYIAPMLFCVGSLLDDITILIEENLKGRAVSAHGRFEFLIRRKDKAVGIVEAKKDNITEGVAQALLGCQVLATNGSDKVFAIVTNVETWKFIRDTKEGIFEDTVYMPFFKKGLDNDLLRQVVGKIYSVLSDD